MENWRWLGDKLKIVQVSAYFSPFSGGSENYCRQLSKRLAERGHEVTVLTSKLRKNSKDTEEIDGVTVQRKWCPAVAWGVNPLAQVLSDLLRSDADIVHAHSYIFLTSLQATLAKNLTGTPLLLHLHGGLDAHPPSHDFTTRIKFLVKKTLYDPTLGRWMAHSADAVASVSQRDIHYAETMWGVNPRNLFWAPNAVDPAEFQGTPRDSPLNVTFIGRLEPWKGIRTFMQVAKIIKGEMSDVEFIIAGDGSLRRDLERGFSDVNAKFLGHVRHEDIPEVLAETSVLVLPSYLEGLPTVCLEAFASSVPVVASDVGGTSEIVKDEETGFLFDAGDVNSCAKSVLALLSNERLRASMGREGRKLVETAYSWNSVVRKIERIYESIIK